MARPPNAMPMPGRPAPGSDQGPLERLIAGNRPFVARERRRTGTDAARLARLVASQRPFATILGCSDSRVPPELLFDQGFGDLFIVRVAGNVVSAEVPGSLQYAGAHLVTPLFVVLGHEGCGAVQAALAWKFRGARARSRIEVLLRSIMPGLTDIDPALPPVAQLRAAVEANVRWSMRQLAETSEGRRAFAERRGLLVGAIYELRTGRVRFLPPGLPAAEGAGSPPAGGRRG
jgi:carbonic anhydrase